MNSRTVLTDRIYHNLPDTRKSRNSMRNPRDNLVFVVALSKKPFKADGDYTWVDVVEKDKHYFHPIGKGWPDVPPNYIAFRYDGQLQSVHYIERYDIVADPSSVNENWLKSDFDQFLYKLGPAMKPSHSVRSGPIWNSRRWCMIDTLLSGSCKTISEAVAETKRRSVR